MENRIDGFKGEGGLPNDTKWGYMVKYVSIISIISVFFTSIGCYNTITVNKNEEIKKLLEDKADLYFLMASDSSEYDFTRSHYSYRFESDTLHGRAKRVTSNPSQKYQEVN